MGGRHQGGTEGVLDHPTRKIAQGAGVVKGWEDKQDHKHIPDTFTYKNDTITEPQDPQQIKKIINIYI